MNLSDLFGPYSLWVVTHKNALGWPDERRHLVFGHYQHRNFVAGGGWRRGRLGNLLEAGTAR